MHLPLTEEEVIVQNIHDLDAGGSPPQLAAVKDMADSLLVEWHCNPVGQNWAATFVKRHQSLKLCSIESTTKGESFAKNLR
jgi:hypothetical protein